MGKLKSFASAVVYAAIVMIAFFVGRLTVLTETKIEYVRGKESVGSIGKEQLVPTKVESMGSFALPYKPIFIKEVEYALVDTAAIIADYEKRKEYKLMAFDDEKGRLELLPVVQYNALQAVDWRFTPVEKVVTKVKGRQWQPFVSASYSTLGYVGVGGGVFYHNIGVEYQCLKGKSENGHLISGKWKF